MAETGTLLTPAAEEPEPAAETEEGAPRRSLRERWDDWRDEWRRIDWEIVRTLVVREALVTVRSAAWTRLLFGFAVLTVVLALLPGLHRSTPAQWNQPEGKTWLVYWSIGTAAALVAAVYHWTSRRIGRELRSGALDEILLTGTGPADILLAKALSAAGIAATLAFAALPASLLAVAVGGRDAYVLSRLWLTLTAFAYVGLYLGLEASLRSEGSARLSYLAWLAFQVSALMAALGKMVGWSWLALPRRALIAFNPISTLLAAAGTRPERWPIGFSVCLLLLVILTLVSFRLLRREWAHAAHRAQKEGWWGTLQRTRRSWRLKQAEELGGERTVEPVQFGERPVAELEQEWGSRVVALYGVWWLLAAIVAIPFIALVIVMRGSVSTVFLLLLGAASVLVAHNASTAMAADRSNGRWQDLVLLPLSNWELVRDKLRPSAESSLIPATGALLVLVATAIIPPGVSVVWAAWAAVTLVTLPLSACSIAALIGVHSSSAAEAQARTAALFAGLPLVLWLADGSLGTIGWLVALHPLVAWSAGKMLLAWTGTLLYAAGGSVALFLLTRKLREWVAG